MATSSQHQKLRLIATRATRQTAQNALGLRFRSRLRSSFFMSPDEAEFCQLRKIKNILTYCLDRVPFYRDRGEEYRDALEATSIDTLLAQLPIIDKATVRAHNTDFFPVPRPVDFFTHTTSGTSGSPVTIGNTIRERIFQEALQAAHLQINGYGWGYRDTAFLSGFFVNPGSDHYIHDPINNNIWFSIYNISDATASLFSEAMLKHKTRIIFGYASAVHSLAAAMARQSIVTPLSAAVTTSEILYPHWRTTISATFGCPVHNQYASQEGAHFAFECADGRMHLHPEVGIVEVTGGSGKGRLGEGVATVTSLRRRSFPLIRYALGDHIHLSPATPCGCGAFLPVIDWVEGRSEDMVRTRDGRLIGYLNFHATKNVPGIVESQLIQIGYDRFDFLYNHLSGASAHSIETAIHDEINRRIGYPVSIRFLHGEQIPRDSRGKFRAVRVLNF